ncbi:MAG: AsmA family protein [Caldimonas sp.]
MKAVIALLAGAAFVLGAVLLQPWWLGPLVARELAASSGRAVHFDRLWIGISAEFEPVVHLAGARIENAPWADARRPFAVAGSAVATVSWRSVAERRPVIAMLVLNDAVIDLERQADGLRNWRLEHPEDRGPGRYKLLALEAHRSTIRFVHRGIGLDLETTATPNLPGAAAPAALDEAMPTRLTVKGAWREVGFTADVATANVLTFLETGRTFRLRGQLDAGHARLDLDGRAGDIFRAPAIDAALVLAGSTLAPFHAFVGPHYREPKTFRVEGRLKAGADRYALTQAQARIGATDLAGDAEYAHVDSRNAFRARLRSASADVADLRWLAGHGAAPRHDARAAAGVASAVPTRSTPSAVPATPAASAAAAPASTAAFDFSAVRNADADLDYAAARLHGAALPALQSVKLKATLAHGQLTLSAIDLGAGDGHATGHAVIALREHALQAEGEFALRGARLEALWRDQPHEKRVTGTLRAEARLNASGASPEALLASTAGRVTATLDTGTISSLLDAEMGLQGGRILRSVIGGAEPIAIRCASVAVDVRRGIGRVRTLVIDTARTRTVGTGTIDLPDETLDLVLTPQAKQGGLLVLDRSIRLHGPLRKIEHSLVERAVGGTGADCVE